MATKTKPASKAATKAAARTAATKPATRAVARKRPAPVAVRAAPAVAKRAVAAAPDSAALLAEVSALLYRQAEALDAKRWQEFIDLFAEDGIYWAPSDPAHEHWDGMPSVFTEDKDLMTVRMRRILHPNAWSQQAEWGTNHVIGNVTIERVDARSGDVHVRSRFHMMELRRDDVRHFAGSYRHHLARGKDGLRIKLQRVDMVNAQAPYEYVLQAWV
jgi:benzoate/toluate 1,2-dioxygenase subunit beta